MKGLGIRDSGVQELAIQRFRVSVGVLKVDHSTWGFMGSEQWDTSRDLVLSSGRGSNVIRLTQAQEHGR